MNILVATSSPRYWRPQAEQLAAEIQLCGHAAEVVTPEVMPRLKKSTWDLLFCIGSGESLAPFLKEVPAKHRILYLIESIPTLTEADDFTRRKLRAHRAYLKAFDHVFVHTRRSIPMLRALGTSSVEELIWPHFPTIYAPQEKIAKDIDVLFVGAESPHRRNILARIATQSDLTVVKGAFHDQLAALLARAKIVVNIHCTPLRNFECRVAETLGCGGFLLTEALEPDDLLRDGEHLVVFDQRNVSDLVARYLQDEEKRRQIAIAGHCAIQAFSVDKQAARIVQAGEDLVHAGSTSQVGICNVDKAHGGRPIQAQSIEAGMAHVKQIRVTINQQIYPLTYPDSPGNDYIVKAVFGDREYPFLPFLAGATVIFDIGANIGCASVLFAALYPAATIFAFEPARDNFAYLQSNTAALPRVRAFNYGMFDRAGPMKLYAGQVSGSTHSLGTSAHNTTQFQEVSLRRPSDVIRELGIERISILKIDTEGAEVPVLQDMGWFLDRVDAVFFEYHSEDDRLELDRLLGHRFILAHGKVLTAHRGVFCYVAKEVIQARTNLNSLAISLPKT